ncbi:MAG: hypothetical protein ACOX7J_06460 [Bacillota bacterium]|jgi:hypothetical protein
MLNLDEARYEQLVSAEVKLEVLYNLLTKNQYVNKADILKLFDWDSPETKDDVYEYEFDESYENTVQEE